MNINGKKMLTNGCLQYIIKLKREITAIGGFLSFYNLKEGKGYEKTNIFRHKQL